MHNEARVCSELEGEVVCWLLMEQLYNSFTVPNTTLQ